VRLTVATRSKVWTVFSRSNIWVMGLNLTRGMGKWMKCHSSLQVPHFIVLPTSHSSKAKLPLHLPFVFIILVGGTYSKTHPSHRIFWMKFCCFLSSLNSDDVKSFKITYDPKVPNPQIISHSFFIRQIKYAVNVGQDRSSVITAKPLRTNKSHISAHYDLPVIINNFNPWLMTTR
jgi:hypothetical protein